MEEPGFDTLVKKHADTADTLALIIDTVNTYSKRPFAKEAAALLCPPGTDRLTCLRNIFDYYCRNVEYTLDKPKKEVVNTPQLTVLNGKGDCKKAATFLGSILLAAGIEPVFKHVYYDNNDEYTHIYIIVPNPDTKNYITLDPTNNCQFNKEVRYSTGSLYFINGTAMDLHLMGNPNDTQESISWSTDEIMGQIEDVGENLMGATVPAALLKTLVKNPHHGKALEHHIKSGKSLNHAMLHTITKSDPFWTKKLEHVPMDLQRGAFLELVRNNADGLASHLSLALGKDPKALDNLWHVVGGDIAHLKKAIIEGAQKKHSPVMHGPEYISGFFSKLLHVGGAILKGVGAAVSVIPGVGPIVGGALTNIGNKAQGISASFPTPTSSAQDQKNLHLDITKDPTGTSFSLTSTPTSKASFFSPAGFAFKSVLLISIYHNHLTPLVESLLGTIAIAAPVLFVALTKIKKIYGS